MEIYDESELTELELERQRNIIKNHEFMKSCGLSVKPLVFVRRSKVDLEKLYAYASSNDSDDQDDEWNGSSTTKKKKENYSRFVPDFKRKVRNPRKYLENVKKKSVAKKSSATIIKKSSSTITKSSSTITKRNENIKKKVENQPIRSRDQLCNKEESAEKKVERYPKRTKRKNYREDDVPDDDHYVFCEDCDEFYYGECTVHTSMQFLADKKQHASDDKKSLATLPDGLEIKESLIPNAGLGVFATQKFDVGVRFGPYQGKKVRPDIPRDDIDTSYMWEIMKDGHVAYYVNGKDEDHGNWMRYINCSRVEVEQNLVAYQYHRHIYYRTYKPMETGDELLVWYGDEYAKDLGIDLHADENQSKLQTGSSDKKIVKLIPGKEYECSKCLKKFEFNIYYEYHMKHSKCSNHGNNDVTTIKMKSTVSSGGGKFACTICEYKSKQSGNLQSHMRTHTDQKTFACTVCEYKFSQSSNLKTHMRTHTNEKPFACTVCEYKSSQLAHLRTHMKTHTNEKPFACTVCEYKCSTSGNLQNHMRTHINEKPFACTVCEYKCSQSANLKRHMRIHTNEKPFACTVCEYKCSQSGSLKSHMRIHTNEKPFACTVCEYKCTQSGSLKSHMRTHTNEKTFA